MADLAEVLLGSPHEEEQFVARVLVSPGEQVVVNELADFGIVPIDLSQALLSLSRWIGSRSMRTRQARSGP